MKFKITRLLSLFMVMFTMFSVSAFANNNNKDYYSKATATAVGEGKVYVSYKNEAATPDYAAESTAESGADNQSSAPTHRYYLYAQAEEGFVFDAWYSDENCEAQLSKDASYELSFKASSTEADKPTTVKCYAKFVSKSTPRYSKAIAKAVGNGKVYVSFANTTDAPEYDLSSEASGVQTDINHVYYMYAQANSLYNFVGWYDNEACTGEALSKDLIYKDSISADLDNEDAPTTKKYYAKFEYANVFECNNSHMYFDMGDAPAANDSIVVWDGAVLSYESSNQNVATVDDEGNITPVGMGSAIISVSDGYEYRTFVVTVIDDSESGITQIGNGDFEDWRGVTSSNHAPDNWNSFETNEGTWASMARAQQVKMVEDHRPGSNGLYCANIYSRSVLGIVAQGNLTTGCINAGATSASNKANYNFSKTSDPKKSETLSKVPTAIRFWAKFVPAAVNAQHPNAHMEAVVHDNTNYITYSSPSYESAAEKAHVIAKARKDFPTTNGEWVEFTAPFELTGNAADGQLYIIVNLATNADPGQGQSGDQLYIDDVELLYDTEYDEVPVVKSEAKYGTFCAPFDVNVPYGMKAYTVQGVKADTSLDMTAVEGTIPANTPVILEGNGAKSLVAYGVAAPAVAEAGLLTGVYADTEAPVGSYVLQNIDDKVGFYQVAAGQQPTVKANRAYLTVSVPKAKVFYFTAEDAEEATGIENVNVNGNVNDGAVYNMAGQKVNKAVKGIYIINGKKVLK